MRARAGLASTHNVVVVLLGCAPASGPPPYEIAPKPTATVTETPPPPEPSYANASTAKLASIDDHAWPPPAIAIDSKTDPKEGEWVAWERPWMHKLEGAPPTFYVTFVRVDPKRKVEFVALDVRQLELDMAIGIEGPFPPNEQKLGKWPRYGGKLPREANVAKRVVAAWNGGFRFAEAPWGMSIRRREWMPPVKDVASLLMHDDGRLGFGTWGPSMKTPDDVRSLRQNLDPLVDQGEVNPRKRLKWGGIKPSPYQVGQRAKRTGICRTLGGHFFYAWGNDLEAVELGNAMKKAGCDYALHMDMNLYHVGFVFMSFEDASYTVGKSEALNALGMGILDKKYANSPNPKEFFYATLREPFHSPVPDDASFGPDGGTQPPPSFLPAILSRSDGEVRVTWFDGRRLRFAMTGGHLELDASGKRLFETAPPRPLAGDDAAFVLASVWMGTARREAPLGLVLDFETRTPPSVTAATLVIDARGRPSIALPGEAPTDVKWSAQAPLIIDGGKAMGLPKELPIAIGLTAKGDVLVAEALAPGVSPTKLLQPLIVAGCVRAVGPRGAGTSKLERAGREVIATGGAETRLYVLADRPPSATYRFDLDEKGTPRWPKVTTPLKP